MPPVSVYKNKVIANEKNSTQSRIPYLFSFGTCCSLKEEKYAIYKIAVFIHLIWNRHINTIISGTYKYIYILTGFPFGPGEPLKRKTGLLCSRLLSSVIHTVWFTLCSHNQGNCRTTNALY